MLALAAGGGFGALLSGASIGALPIGKGDSNGVPNGAPNATDDSTAFPEDEAIAAMREALEALLG